MSGSTASAPHWINSLDSSASTERSWPFWNRPISSGSAPASAPWDKPGPGAAAPLARCPTSVRTSSSNGGNSSVDSLPRSASPSIAWRRGLGGTVAQGQLEQVCVPQRRLSDVQKGEEARLGFPRSEPLLGRYRSVAFRCSQHRAATRSAQPRSGQRPSGCFEQVLEPQAATWRLRRSSCQPRPRRRRALAVLVTEGLLQYGVNGRRQPGRALLDQESGEGGQDQDRGRRQALAWPAWRNWPPPARQQHGECSFSLAEASFKPSSKMAGETSALGSMREDRHDGLLAAQRRVGRRRQFSSAPARADTRRRAQFAKTCRASS